MGFYSVMRSSDLGFLSLRSARPSWGTTGECVPVLRERNGKRAPKKCRKWRTCVRRRRRSCFFHPPLVRTTGCTNQFSLCAFTRVDSSPRATTAAALPSQSKKKTHLVMLPQTTGSDFWPRVRDYTQHSRCPLSTCKRGVGNVRE